MSTADRPSRRYLRASYRLLTRLVLGSLVLLVVASLGLVLFFDPLFQLALARAGRDLNGTLTVGRAYLGLGNFTLRQVRLTAPPSGEVFTADRITVRLHPWSLLSQGLVEGIGDAEVENPGLRVVVDPYGMLNLSSVLPSPPEDRPPLLADYQGVITLRNGWVLYRDERSTGFLYQLKDWQGRATFKRGSPAELRCTLVPDQPSPGRVAITGEIGVAGPGLDLSMELKSLSLRPFSVHPSVPPWFSLTEGTLSGDLWVRGKADDWDRIALGLFPAGKVALKDVVLHVPDLPWPIEFDGSFSVAGGTARILRLGGQVGAATFGMQGHFLLGHEPWLDGTLQARLDLAQAVKVLHGGTPPELAGAVKLDLGVEGPLANPQVSGVIGSGKVLVDGEALQDLKAVFELDRKSLQLQELHALIRGGEIRGSGWVFLGDNPRVALKLKGENTRLPEPLAAYAGTADFDVTVLGGRESPVVFGQGSLLELGPWSQGLQEAAGRFLYGGKSIVLWDATAARDSGLLQLPLAFLDLEDRFVAASVSSSGFPIPQTTVAGRPVTGLLRGDLSVWGPWEEPALLQARGLLTGTRLSYGGFDADNLTGGFLFSEGAVLLPGLTGTLAGGKVELAGWVEPLAQRMDLGVLGQGLDLAELTRNPLLGSPVALSGTGNLGLSLRGGAGRDHFLGYLESGAGSLAGLGYSGSAGELGLVGFANGLDLDVLPLPGLERTGGRLTAMLGLQGTRQRAKFLYTGRISDGQALGLEYLDANGEGLYTGDALLLGPNMLSWANPDVDYEVGHVAYSGHAFGYFGPVLSRPLEVVDRPDIVLPDFGLLTLDGRIDLARRRLNLRYKGRGLELGWLASRPWLGRNRTLNDLLALRIDKGLLFSEGRLGGTFRAPDIRAAVRIPWLSLAGEGTQEGPRSILSLAGTLDLQRDRLKVEPLFLSSRAYDPRLPQVDPAPLPERLEQGMMKLDGQVITARGGSTADLHVSAQQYPLEDLMALGPQAAASFMPYGRLTTQGLHLWGSPRNPSVAGRVRLQDGGIWLDSKPLPLDQALVAFTSHQGAVHVSDVEVLSGPLEIHGRGSRTPQGDFTASLWAREVPLEYLRSLGPPLSGLAGDLDLALSLRTRRGVPTAYLAIQSERLRWDPQVVGGKGGPLDLEGILFGRLERDPAGPLHTGPGLGVELSFRQGRVHLEIPEGALAVRLAGGESGQLAAAGAVSFAIPGEESPGEWFTSPAGPDFGQQGEPFRVRATELSLAGLKRLLGARSTGFRAVTDAELELEGQWARDHLLEASGALPRYALQIGRLELEGRHEQSRSGFRLTPPASLTYQRQGRFGLVHVEPLAVEFFRAGPDPLPPLVEEVGRLTAAGDLVLMEPPGDEVPQSRLELSIEKLPLQNLGFLLPEGLEVSGLLQHLQLQLAGRLLSPQLSVLIDFSGGRLGAAEFAGIAGGLTGSPTDLKNYAVKVGQDAGRPLQIYFGQQRSENQKLSLQGEVGLSWQQTAEPPRDRLHLAWEGQKLVQSTLALQADLLDQDLKFLGTLLPGDEKTSGRMQGSLKVTGSLEQPELEGQVVVENGFLDTPLLGNAITGLNVDTRFERISAEEAEPSPLLRQPGFLGRYSVRQFAGRLGGQPFQVTGKAELAGLTPTFLNVNLLGEALPIEVPNFFSGLVNLNLTLVGRAARNLSAEGFSFIPVLEGRVEVPQGDIHIPLALVAGERPREITQALGLPPVRYDIALTLGDDVWVNVLSASVRVQGELQVLSGDHLTPVLAGALFLSRGTLRIPIYEAAFRVRQGWAYFERSLTPVLDNVEADTDLGGYRITARFDGQYPDSIRTEFVSNPPLPQAELARIVVMGGLPEAFLGANAGNLAMSNFLADEGVSLLSGLLTNQLTEGIGRLFFLSEITFDYIPPAQYVVKLAKALDRRDTVLLTLTRIVKQDNFVENLFGLEWRFQPNLLVRVARDDLDQFRFWFQSLLRF